MRRIILTRPLIKKASDAASRGLTLPKIADAMGVHYRTLLTYFHRGKKAIDADSIQSRDDQLCKELTLAIETGWFMESTARFESVAGQNEPMEIETEPVEKVAG